MKPIHDTYSPPIERAFFYLERDMQEATIKDAPEFLDTNDQAMWVLGYNEAVLKMQCKGCAVQEGTHVPAEAVAQIQEPAAKLKDGYYDGDDDDEDGTPLFQSAEEVIRRSAEVRELRAGDVICIVQLVNDEYANEQHARLTSIDDPDADTEHAWVFISDGEAKAYYEDKQAQKRTVLHPKRIENVIFRMNKEGDSQAAETVQAQRDLIATLTAQLEAIGAGGVEPLRKPVQATDAEPFGYVNTHTGQFFKDVEPCRKNNEGHWRTVYTHPTQQGLEPITGPCGQCKDSHTPCACTLQTMLKERGLTAVDEKHYLKISQQAKSNTNPTQQGLDAEYQRGYQDGYNRRDAEVKGALV